ncbi:MAG: NUDIX hydrolase [Anaerolineae bacterium]|nr:NUDIX hydrolase [Anaerolineae bacterium]
MAKRVLILKEDVIFQKLFFSIKEAELQHERYDGEMSPVITRISFERRNAVAAVLHNPDDDTIILTEQFRYPTVATVGGWIKELPAGVMEEGEEPAITMQRELVEETGYQAEALHNIGTFFVSPGGSSERVFLYYARIQKDSKHSEGGGLVHEGEDIKTEILKVDDALKLLQEGAIMDAKTVIGLQWLQLHRDHLPK